jgi:hypothetical protein
MLRRGDWENIADLSVAIFSSETSVTIYQFTRRNTPEGLNFSVILISHIILSSFPQCV